jgi:hypothetical protein
LRTRLPPVAGCYLARHSTPPPLVGNQPDVYRACLSPGVRLVWGSPGTRKAQVLAWAIHDLVDNSKRSCWCRRPTWPSVNALDAVAKAMWLQPRCGVRSLVGFDDGDLPRVAQT